MLGNVVELAEGKDHGWSACSAGSARRRTRSAPYSCLAAAGVTAPADAAPWVLLARARCPVRLRLRARGDARTDRARDLADALFIRDLSVAWAVDAPWRRSATWRRSPPPTIPLLSCSCCRSSRSCARSPASAGAASTMRSSSAMPTGAPRSCSATSSRPTTATPARTAATSSRFRSRWRTRLGSTRAPGGTPSSWRCCTTSARSGSRTRSSTSPAR